MRRMFLMSSVLLVAPFMFGETGEASAQCVATTDCASLGYTETSCPNGGIKCPFGSTWSCKTSGNGSGDSPIGGDGEDEVTVDNKVGAIYYSDGTISPDILPEKTAIGVVGYANGNHGLVVALKTSVLKWSEDPADSNRAFQINVPCLINYNADGDDDGAANTACLIKTAQERGNPYPAAQYCYKYETWGKSAGEWYLPGAQELYAVAENKEILNDVLIKLKAANISSNYAFDREFWSSNEECGIDSGREYCLEAFSVDMKWGNISVSGQMKDDAYTTLCMFSY